MPPGINGSIPTPFVRQGLGYLWLLPQLGGLRLHADRLLPRGEYLSGEIILEDTEGHWIFDDRVSLNSAGARKKFAQVLVERIGHRENSAEWATEIELFCAAIRREWRRGAPIVEIGGDLPPEFELAWQIGPLLPYHLPVSLYGPWSAGKSMLAVAMAVSVAAGRPFAGHPVRTGPVLYIDHEVNVEVFSRRVWAVSHGLGLERPPGGIHYQRARGKLHGQIERMSEAVAERRIELLIVDSVGMAAGAAGERGSYEDIALELFEALEALPPCTVLLLDHVSGEGRKGKLAGKAFGSEYKTAMVRMSWEARKQQSAESRSMAVGLYNTKPFSESPAQRPLGFRLQFQPGSVRIEEMSITENSELDDRQTDQERMRSLLIGAGGSLSVKQLAESMRVSESQVRVVARRYPEIFSRTPDGKQFQVVPERPGGSSSEPYEDQEIPF